MVTSEVVGGRFPGEPGEPLVRHIPFYCNEIVRQSQWSWFDSGDCRGDRLYRRRFPILRRLMQFQNVADLRRHLSILLVGQPHSEPPVHIGVLHRRQYRDRSQLDLAILIAQQHE